MSSTGTLTLVELENIKQKIITAKKRNRQTIQMLDYALNSIERACMQVKNSKEE